MPARNKQQTTASESVPSNTYRYSSNTRAFAKNEGHTVSRLLWQKIMTSLSPRVQQMLITFLDLRTMLHLIVPEEYVSSVEQPVEHKQLVAQVQKAERFLTSTEEDASTYKP